MSLIEGKGIIEEKVAGTPGGRESVGKKALRLESVNFSWGTLGCDVR